MLLAVLVVATERIGGVSAITTTSGDEDLDVDGTADEVGFGNFVDLDNARSPLVTAERATSTVPPAIVFI